MTAGKTRRGLHGKLRYQGRGRVKGGPTGAWNGWIAAGVPHSMSGCEACVASKRLAAMLARMLSCCNPPGKHNNEVVLAKQHNHQSHNTLCCGGMPRRPEALHPELELLLQDLAHNGWVTHSCTCLLHVCTNEPIEASLRQGHKGCPCCQVGKPVCIEKRKWIKMPPSDQLQTAAAPAAVPAPACSAGTSAAGAVAMLCLS